MHISELLHPAVLADEVAGRWVRARRHPDLPLTIYNYSKATQYDRRWNGVTRTCRGLVVDDDGLVAARPLPKFHNDDELQAGELPAGPFRVFEKLDGYLLIVFVYDGHLVATTRGSFESPQAQIGRALLTGRYGTGTGPFTAGTTYMFELLVDDGNAIVDYGPDRDLIALTAIDNDSGHETLPGDGLEELGWPVAGEVDVPAGTTVADLHARERDNAEGYVVRYGDGRRVKVKFAGYRRRARARQGLTARNIWLAWWEQRLGQMVEDVPDEDHETIHKVVDQIETVAAEAVHRAEVLADRYDHVPVAELAAHMQSDQVPKTYHGLVFQLRHGKPVDRNVALKNVTEPHADELPTVESLPPA